GDFPGMIELGHHIDPSLREGVLFQEPDEIRIMSDPMGKGDRGSRAEPDEGEMRDIREHLEETGDDGGVQDKGIASGNEDIVDLPVLSHISSRIVEPLKKLVVGQAYQTFPETVPAVHCTPVGGKDQRG